MQDPHPENITGEKRHTFSWDVSVDVGHVLLALALLAVVVKVAPLFVAEDDDRDDEDGAQFA